MDLSLSEDEKHVYWENACQNWLNQLKGSLASSYRIHETDNFSILSDEDDRYLELFSNFLENKLNRILKTLSGIASDEGYGKHVALIFKDVDQYYHYIDLYYPDEGDFAPNSGVHINDGYGHFAFPTQDLYIAEPIAVHELTHACLAHLHIPTWLNEGIAVTMEETLSDSHHNFMTSSIMRRHQRFWSEESIQRFWRGESFHELGDGQELSYSLAYILVRNISKDYDIFQKFVNDAFYYDSGESSALRHLGISLAQLIEGLFGAGSWVPKVDAS